MKPFAKKEKKQKDPLLQTYFVSLLSLVLCVAMFLGTTFAWFSSDVTSQDNQIFVGTLSVKLSHWGKGYTEWKTVDASEKILDPDIRWEPGYTTVEWLKLENTGDLALNYRLKMASTAANAETVLAAIGQYFTVYANTAITQATYTMPESFEDMIAEESWVEIGTLDQVMLGKAIVSGEMNNVQTTGVDGEGNEIVNTPAVEFAFAIHMDKQTPAVLDDAAKTSVMGQKLEGISVKLEAWQNNKEEDVFGSDYDHLVTSAVELKAAFASGGKAILAADIDLEGEDLTITAGKVLDLDLYGYEIKGDIDDNTYGLIRVLNGATLNISDSRDGGAIIAEPASDSVNGTAIWLEGEMNLHSGSIIKTAGGDFTFGVDVRPNAWGTAHTAPCVLRVYGGTINGNDTHAVRLAVNSSENYADSAASLIMNGGELTGKDGVFIQMLDTTYRPLNVTINGGTVSGTNAAIRVYAPTMAKCVGVEDGKKAINITVTGGTFVSKSQADNAAWISGNIIKVQHSIDYTSVEESVLAPIKEQMEVSVASELSAGK